MRTATGINLPPWLAGLIRAIIIAALFAAINAAIVYFSNPSTGEMVAYQALIVAFLRQVEAALDQALRPHMNAVTPTEVARGE